MDSSPLSSRAQPLPGVSACGCVQPAPASLWRWGRIAFSGVLAVNAMAVALAVNTSADSPSDLQFNPQAIRLGLLLVTLLVAGLVGTPLLQGAWDSLRRKRVAVELLFLLTLSGAFGVSVQSLWTATGPVYFEVVCLLLVVYAFGAELNRTARDRATDALRALSAALRLAHVRREDGTLVDLPAADVPPGARIEVLPGEMVPVDGTLLEEDALFEETTLRGEFVPRSRAAGEPVLAGCFAVDTLVCLRASTHPVETSLDSLVCDVGTRIESGSKVEQAADRLARWFVPVVTATATLTFLGWSAFVPWADALFHAMAVLLVACPCALGFATPLALWTAVSRVQSFGLRVSRVQDMEQLASVDAIAFDKTGTLSAAEARVDAVVWQAASPEAPALPYPPETLAHILAAAEAGLSHPYARALSRGWAAEAASGSVSSPWRRIALRILPGKGIRARVANDAGAVHELEIAGCPQLAGEASRPSRGVTPDAAALGSASDDATSGPGIVISLDGLAVGWARFREEFRQGHRSALTELAGMGIAVRLLSGDDPSRALHAGIDAALGNQSPAEKCDAVLAWKASGRTVLFIGDGLNDASAMAAAHVAIALEEGAPLARAVAGIGWDGRNLSAIPAAIRIARQTLQRVHVNFRWALGYNLIGMALAAAGLLHPVTAALLMVASSTQVTWRAMALLGQDDALAREQAPPREQDARPGPAPNALQWSDR